MVYPQPIAFADITPGMNITATTTVTATGASSAITSTVTAAGAQTLTIANGDWVQAPAGALEGTTISYQLNAAPPATIPPPDAGIILTDETGTAWQAIQYAGPLTMSSINGDRLTWAQFADAHPGFTVMQDEPVVALPDPPPAGYPVTIGPGDARLGMDVRVTVTYATGESRVVRGLCPWVQQNPPPDDDFPSFLFMPNIGGAQIVADPDVLDTYVTNNPDAQAQIAGRYVVQYDPLPAGITLLVEQMQAWTADSVWDISGTPEPPTGSIVRSKTGIAWQRTGDATQDGDWYQTGQGLWSSVIGDFPRSFLWLWGAAAPFTLQQPAP